MNTTGQNEKRGREAAGRPLSTADLAAAGRRSGNDQQRADQQRAEGMQQPADANRVAHEREIGDDEATGTFETLEPLFTPDLAETYRARWTSIQSSFVDDPRRAVRSGDELVAQIMSNLAKTFAEERHRVESQLDQTGEGATENLRVALRRYRSFFERLLVL